MSDQQQDCKQTLTGVADLRAPKKTVLKLSEEEHKLLFNTMAQGVVFQGSDGIIIKANPAAEDILGLSLDQMIGSSSMDPLWQMIKEDRTPLLGLEHPAMIALQTGNKVGPIIRGINHPHKQGSVWLSIIATPLFKPFESKPYQVYSTFDDITVRKQLEEALQSNEKFLETILQTTIDGFLVVNNQKHIIQVNDAYCEMSGYTRDEILSMAIHDLQGLETPEETTIRLKRIIENGSELYQTEHRRKDGTILPLELSVTYLPKDCGQFVGFCRDITERKQIEAQIQKVNERLEQQVKNRTAQLERSLENTKIINQLITLVLKKISIPELLDEALKLILSIPWLTLENKGAIYLLENDHLVTVAKRGLAWRAEETNATIPLNQCLCGHAAQSGEVQFAPVPDEFNELTFDGIKPQGYYCIPIKSAHKIYGVLNVFLHKGYRRNKNEEDFILSITNILTEILKRKITEENVVVQAQRADALLQISSKLNAELNIDKVKRIICEEVCSALTMPMSAYLRYDSITQLYHLEASEGLPEEVARTLEPISQEDIKLLLIKQGQVRVIHDVSALPKLPVFQTLLNHGIPIKAYSLVERDGVILGILLVGGNDARVFSEDAIALLLGISNQAASAITNSQQFTKTKTSLSAVQALRNIDLAITGSLDLRVTFQVILDEVTSMLDFDAAAILLLDPSSSILKYTHWRGFRSKNIERIIMPLGKGYPGNSAKDGKSIYVNDLRDNKRRNGHTALLIDEGFISYSAVPLVVKGAVIGVLEVLNRDPHVSTEEWLSFLESFAVQAAIAIDNAKLFSKIQRSNTDLLKAYDKTIQGWAFALGLKDEETADHSQRVTELTLRISEKMGIDEVELSHVRRGALLHDIGKMGIPDYILLKNGKLTDEEWDIMRMHPIYAFEMLSTIDYLRPAMDIPYCHHERWDGSGYPRGLNREQIPLSARIFAMVDVYDALTSDRPYRKAWTKEKTLEYIQEQSGKMFDPQVHEVFVNEISG